MIKKPKYLLISNSNLENALLKALVEENPNIEYLGVKPYNQNLGSIIDHYDPDVLLVNGSMDTNKKEVLKAYVQNRDVSVMFSSFGSEDEDGIPSNLNELPSDLIKPAIHLSSDVDSLKMFLDDHFDKRTKKSSEYIFVRSEKRMVKVSTKEIMYVEGLADYVKIFLENGTKIVTQRTMSSVLNELPDGRFIRINRSNIVQGSKIDSFNRSSVFIGDKMIPIGKGYKDVFKALIKSY